MSIREYIEHVLAPGSEVTQEEVAQLGVQRSRAAVSGAFLGALETYFGSDPTPGQTTDLVALVRARHVDPAGLPPMLGEALIRAVYGEGSLMSGMDRSDATRGQILLTVGIVRELALEGAAYQDFLDRAARTAEQILAEAASPQ